eukprot:SAG11_NODE_308_length_10943_cov_6.679609_8_plen_126_part_00
MSLSVPEQVWRRRWWRNAPGCACCCGVGDPEVACPLGSTPGVPPVKTSTEKKSPPGRGATVPTARLVASSGSHCSNIDTIVKNRAVAAAAGQAGPRMHCHAEPRRSPELGLQQNSHLKLHIYFTN